ncbi:MAG: hypothetical protein ACD_83C00190G0002 [uncultured bacterium]|nr:MAG: hypothetical protein ACD_83C00190G0002 [uncultured bacterium]
MSNLPPTLLNLIPGLTYDQIRELYEVVLERIRFLHKAKQMAAMRHLNLYDQVYFEHHGIKYYGRVERMNQKTVSVVVENPHGYWRIAPEFITKILVSEEQNSNSVEVNEFLLPKVESDQLRTNALKHRKAKKQKRENKQRKKKRSR